MFIHFTVAMDIASGEHGNVLARLVSAIDNGRLIYQESSTTPTSTTPSLSHGTSRHCPTDNHFC